MHEFKLSYGEYLDLPLDLHKEMVEYIKKRDANRRR